MCVVVIRLFCLLWQECVHLFLRRKKKSLLIMRNAWDAPQTGERRCERLQELQASPVTQHGGNKTCRSISQCFSRVWSTVSGVASPCLVELRGAAGGAVGSSSHEASGVNTAVVLGGLVEDHVVPLVMLSGSERGVVG